MRLRAIPILILLALAVGCDSTSGHGVATTPSAGASPRSTVGAGAPTSLPITSLSASNASDSSAPAGVTGTILMIKLQVSDLSAAERFYGMVFGAKPALAIGNGAHIVTFPNGGPGLVLLTAKPNKKMTGAFIIRVPNLREAQARAVANGAKLQGTFSGNPGGQAARSVDLLDPWGNQVEILQIG